MGIYRNNPSGWPRQAAYPNLAPQLEIRLAGICSVDPLPDLVVILETAEPNSTGVLFTPAMGPSTKVTALKLCLNSFSYG